MFKEFFIKNIFKDQLKHIPAEQRDKFVGLFLNNLGFFEKITKEVQAEIATGKDQMSATQVVLAKYQTEIQKLLSA